MLVLFAAYTGLRASEIARLRVQDVDFEKVEIKVRQTYRKIDGVWTFGTPKSERSTREVPILHGGLLLALKKLLLLAPRTQVSLRRCSGQDAVRAPTAWTTTTP